MAHQKLEHQASIDPLTGCVNRRGLAKVVPQHADVVVLAADLDGLKAVNDSAGDDAGDADLVRFADLLRNTVRPGDVSPASAVTSSWSCWTMRRPRWLGRSPDGFWRTCGTRRAGRYVHLSGSPLVATICRSSWWSAEQTRPCTRPSAMEGCALPSGARIMQSNAGQPVRLPDREVVMLVSARPRRETRRLVW